MSVLESGVITNPSEIYRYTLSEIGAIIRGAKANMRNQMVFFGTLTAAVYNTIPRKKNSGKTPLKWTDIYPDITAPKKEQSVESMCTQLRLMFGAPIHVS